MNQLHVVEVGSPTDSRMPGATAALSSPVNYNGKRPAPASPTPLVQVPINNKSNSPSPQVTSTGPGGVALGQNMNF